MDAHMHSMLAKMKANAADTAVVSKQETREERNARRLMLHFTAEEKVVLQQWADARDWSVILDLNRAFLRGEQEFTPTYLSPIDAETLPMVPALLALHDYGIFTHTSQPGIFVGPTKDDNDPPWYQIQQRAYLTFVVPRGECGCEVMDATQVKKFLDELMTDTNFHTNIIGYDGICQNSRCSKNLYLRNNFPMDWATHKQQVANTKDQLDGAKVTERQIFETDCTCKLGVFKRHGQLLSHMSPYMVHVLAKTWEDTDLPALVKAAAERAGMKPIFAKQEEGIPEIEKLELGDDDGNVPDLEDTETGG